MTILIAVLLLANLAAVALLYRAVGKSVRYLPQASTPRAGDWHRR